VHLIPLTPRTPETSRISAFLDAPEDLEAWAPSIISASLFFSFFFLAKRAASSKFIVPSCAIGDKKPFKP
jgi:hypothetical protein